MSEIQSASTTCGCCDDDQRLAQPTLYNPPGLAALNYRIGDHASFLRSLLKRLSSQCLGSPEDCRAGQGRQPLQALKTRSTSDPSIALLDAWAVMGDVLTFYQERIANEGFLRTALERRSVLELARLVGFRLRPGVAASVFLAYEMEAPLPGAASEPSTILKTARVQSVPGPGETAQTFETVEDLEARYEWNNLQPRQAQPFPITLANALLVEKLYFKSLATNLKPNDPLLLVFQDKTKKAGQDEIAWQVLRRVEEVTASFEKGTTEVLLQPVPTLAVLLADLLQVAVTALAAQIERFRADGMIEYLPWLEGFHRFFLRLLENVRLGNYPPDLAVAGHSSIYGLLFSLVTGSSSPTEQQSLLAAPFVRMLARAVVELIQYITETRQASGFPDNPDTGDIFRNAFVEPLTAVLKRAVELLGLQMVKQQLAEVFQNLAREAMPLDSRERLLLIYFFSQKNLGSIFAQIHRLRPGLQALAQKGAFDNLAGLLLELMTQVGELLFVKETHQRFSEEVAGLARLVKDAQENGRELFVPGTDHLFIPLEPALASLNNTQEALGAITPSQPLPAAPVQQASLLGLVNSLSKPASLQPAGPAQLKRSVQQAFRAGGDSTPRLILSFQPELRTQFYKAWANTALPAPIPELEAVHALRLAAAPFGYNAPVRTALKKNDQKDTKDIFPFISDLDGDWTANENPRQLFLDSEYPAILPGSYVVLRKDDSILMAARAEAVTLRPRTEYTLSAKSTRLSLSRPWWDGTTRLNLDKMAGLRSTSILAQSEPLPLAPFPEDAPVEGAEIELETLQAGLESGRWLIISGERVDIPGTTGIQASELAMVLGVEQRRQNDIPGEETARTVLKLARPLAYRYQRLGIAIYGNVVKATHGETHPETLGSGDGGKVLQSFVLHQPPVTYLAAVTPDGAQSTLAVRVNDLLWSEANSFLTSGPSDRIFVTKTNDEGKTTVTFGDGIHGARLPSGTENITAVYRSGIGSGGNVRSGQLSIMLTRPLHARGVNNPLPATGGADPDSRDQARQIIPRSATALGRLVSVQDYADFASTFAGIAKTSARRLSDSRRQVVLVTIAGIGDIPISVDSDLFISLSSALHEFGDPAQPVRLALRELLLMVLSADISIQPEYRWQDVEAQVRLRLLDQFGFERRSLGEDVVLSQVTAVIQAVDGVRSVDVNALDALDRQTILQNLPDAGGPQASPATITTPSGRLASELSLAERLSLKPRARLAVEMERLDQDKKVLLPAQLAYFTPDVPETLILNLREG